MSSFNKNFGEKLRQARLNANFTQEKIADKMNVSVTSIQNWESGKTNIRDSRLKELSEFYNISLSTLIKDKFGSFDEDIKDNFPYFLFDDNTNKIINTLHLSLIQQELFSMLYIYDAEYLHKKYMDSDMLTLREDLKKLPYEFINKIGSIQLLNIAHDLFQVIKYIQTDFLISILKSEPKKEFNICTLSKELICDFIDGGYKEVDLTELYIDYDHALYLNINMHKAKKILPVLNEAPVHLTDEWWSNPLRDDVPEIIKETGKNVVEILCGIKRVTSYEEDNEKRYILSINDTGKKLLEWFYNNDF